jgi:hypothetical protein
MKHLLDPFMFQRFFAVEYAPEKCDVAPWRICGVHETNFEGLLVRPNLKRKSDPLFRTSRLTPLTKTYQTTQTFLTMACRVLGVIHSVGIVVAVYEASQSHGGIAAALTCRLSGFFKFYSDHAIKAPNNPPGERSPLHLNA